MLAVLVAEASFPERSSAWRFPGAGWVVHTSRAELVVVAETLVERARFPLPSAWRAVHCVTPDLGYAAISERDRVLLINPAGRSVWEARHQPWGDGGSESGSCWVSADGNQIWATVPNAAGPDEWWVIDATPHDGTVLALHAFPGGSVLARQGAEGVLNVDDSYEFQGGYLTGDLVIAGSVEKQSHWLFDSSTLRPIAELRYPPNAVKGCILPSGRGTWLTSDYLGGTHQVWRMGETMESPKRP